MGFTATSAHAGESFWVENELVDAMEGPAEVESEEDKAFTLTVLKEGRTITCEKFKLNDGFLLFAGTSSGTMQFEGCKTSGCTVENISTNFIDELIPHGGVPYDVVIPTGTSFVTIKYLGAECKAPAESKLKSTFVLEDGSGQFEKEAVSHLLKFAAESLFKSITEKNELTISGSMQLKLKGANAGKTWKASLIGPKGDFKIKGTNIASTTEVAWEEDKAFTFLWPSLSVEIGCGVLVGDDGLLFVGGESSVTLLFKKCRAFSMVPKLEELIGCTVADIVAKVAGTLIAHGGKTYDLFENGGFAFTTFSISGKGCALLEKIEVRGALVLEDTGKGLEVEAEKHLLQQAPAALFPNYKLKVGVDELRLDGSTSLALSGKNLGMFWNGVAL
jgi:hypothetical protein